MLAGVDWRPDWFWFDSLTLELALTAVGFRLLFFRELEREDIDLLGVHLRLLGALLGV